MGSTYELTARRHDEMYRPHHGKLFYPAATRLCWTILSWGQSSNQQLEVEHGKNPKTNYAIQLPSFLIIHAIPPSLRFSMIQHPCSLQPLPRIIFFQFGSHRHNLFQTIHLSSPTYTGPTIITIPGISTTFEEYRTKKEGERQKKTARKRG